MVIVREGNLPRGKYLPGRITHALPLEDGIIRVVTVKTAEEEHTRPTANIVPLECRLQWWGYPRTGVLWTVTLIWRIYAAMYIATLILRILIWIPLIHGF